MYVHPGLWTQGRTQPLGKGGGGGMETEDGSNFVL